MKYVIDITYLSHIYPYFVLNFMSVPLYIIRKWNVGILKPLNLAPLAYFLFFILVNDFAWSVPQAHARLRYKDSLTFKIFDYMQNKIPPGSKVANDHFVGVPANSGLVDCDYWASGCGTDYIEQFQPDYIVFYEDWTFNGEFVAGNLRLKRYIKDHNFILVDTISTEGNPMTISVWKKPDP
jgi:hypothetical protein